MRLLVLLISLLFVAPALADVTPVLVPGTAGRQCSSWLLCSGQTATGACLNSGSSPITFKGSGLYEFTLHASGSTGTFICDSYVSGIDQDAGGASDKTVLTDYQMTDTNRSVSYRIAPSHLWIECSTMTAANVTITASACKVD